MNESARGFFTGGAFTVPPLPEQERMVEAVLFASRAPLSAREIGERLPQGCDVAEAGRLVYADGVDLENLQAAVPIGISCRVCERTDCRARAFPSLHQPLAVDENVRGVSFFTPVPARPG